MNRMQPRDVACNVMRVRRMRPIGYIREKQNERGEKNKNESEKRSM